MMFLDWITKKLFAGRNKRIVNGLWPLVRKVNELAESFRSLTDEQLQSKTLEFKERLQKGETTDDIMCEAYAVVKDACRRLKESTKEEEHFVNVTGHRLEWDMVPFDVQIMGGIVLHQHKIAEMATGEGKTLVATMPLYLNALTGRNAQLVTVNDYLAKRDSDWMGHLYKWLGLTVGCLQNNQSPDVRREQYNCDITYGTNSEFGFDYLRDMGMAHSSKELVQRDHFYAIVDEIDSILIDEARTPLIIAGPAKVSTHMYDKVKPMVEALFNRQYKLMADLLQKAKTLLDKENATDNEKDEAYHLLARVQIGMPRHKLLRRFMEDAGVRKGLERVDIEWHSDTNRGLLQDIKEELYFTVDEKGGESELSEKGRRELMPADPQAFVIPDLPTIFSELDADTVLTDEAKLEKRKSAQVEYDRKSELLHNISQLLRAYCLFEKDVQYVVQDNKVIIVDEFTGRPQPGRRFSEGLHQALEAKENVQIERETQTLASITIQNYFRMYDKLAGMTGTAATEATEFKSIYNLDVVTVPTNRPCKRIDYNDRIYKTQREKYRAIIEEIAECNKKGQPVLVGTISVEVSELLSRLLTREHIIHNVLNAKQHQSEAEIVARAGQRGAVTIATNMAGRGTDIKLGPGVKELGGLHVIGSERHDARRIDLQLRGRCSRQGDPGSSRFYISLEDNLMRLFGSDRVAGIMERLGLEEGQELSHPLLNSSIEKAQKRVEQQHFGIRKRTLEYDDVMNKQRVAIYGLRHEILTKEDSRQLLMDFIRTAVGERVDAAFAARPKNEALDTSELQGWLSRTVPFTFPKEIFTDSKNQNDSETMIDAIMEKINEAYTIKENVDGEESSRWLERYIMLNALDNLYQGHLYDMDDLRQSVQLRSYGQRDPLVEYKQEAYNLYSTLLGSIKDSVCTNIFRYRVVRRTPDMERTQNGENGEKQASQREQHVENPDGSQEPRRPAAPSRIQTMHQSFGQFEGTASRPAQPMRPITVRREQPKVGRNDPCPCGSGKKYKACCGTFNFE
ncbi:MAG: preprotein translocase subunit SecA [Lentisphaeria bacterium]|nr:preprotein translocase subunit SecA [Lentisphaeria bacterium]